MKRRSVRRRIFLSNALMVLSTLLLFLILSVGTAKVYWESVELELRSSAEVSLDPEVLEELIRDLTIRQNEFFCCFSRTARCVLRGCSWSASCSRAIWPFIS